MYVHRSPTVYGRTSNGALTTLKSQLSDKMAVVVRVMKIHESAGSKLFLKLLSYTLIISQILIFNEVFDLTGREGNLRARCGSIC